MYSSFSLYYITSSLSDTMETSETSSPRTMFIAFYREPKIPAAIYLIFPNIIDNRMRRIANDETMCKTPKTFYDLQLTSNSDMIEFKNWEGAFVCLNPKVETGTFLLFKQIFGDRAQFYTDHALLMSDHPEATIQRKQTNFSIDVYCSTLRVHVMSPKSPKSPTCPHIDPHFMPPSVIIEGKLFLGGFYCIDPKFFDGIHNVVSLVPDCDLPKFAKNYKDKGKHLHIPIKDNFGEEISNYFEEFNKFLDNAFAKEETVYVHCAAGISRSASFVIAYFMEKMQMDLETAAQFVKEKRKIIEPNLHFAGTLLIYHRWLKSDRKLSLREFQKNECKKFTEA